jgi:hypothetical protein
MCLAAAAACSGDANPAALTPGSGTTPPGESGAVCSIPLSDIFDGGVGRDGIRSLENPKRVPVDHVEASYLIPEDRVIGVEVDGQAIAVPHNILWWHEIVNFDIGDTKLAVTFCPLTGSSMVFDRSAVAGSEFGVSGLLFRNNLIMFDRDTESLWPQMMRESTCGVGTGSRLPLYPAIEMNWTGWKALHPEGSVLSSQTGFSRSYTRYPYGDYDDVDNPETLFPHPDVSERRPPKERVLGVVQGSDGGTVFPFGVLGRRPVRAVHVRSSGRDAVVLWDRAAESAMAYFRDPDVGTLGFKVEADQIVDEETGSVWAVNGLAVSGPLAGTRLEPVPDAYVAFWFSWVTFQPETSVWFGT